MEFKKVDSPLRQRMADAAVAVARVVGYRNAGTVEFLLAPSGEFYFLEVNTRLQVEHPITELVTGIDLVQAQLRIAAGEPLWIGQADIRPRGHAIECRVYAEDPAHGFLPSTGRLLQYIEPRGPGIRVDSGVAAGSEVTHFYDPLLAKLIVHAGDRPSAVQRMQAALREFIVHGVVTNFDFLQAVLLHPDFQSSRVTTQWRYSAARAAGVGVLGAMGMMPSPLGKGLLKGGYRVGAGLAKFAWNHPFFMTAAAAVGIASWGTPEGKIPKGPGVMLASSFLDSAGTGEVGSLTQARTLANSTDGLVFGLNRRRHS